MNPTLQCSAKKRSADLLHPGSYQGRIHIKTSNHRRRIKTEAKAKVVAAVWGTEIIQFVAALAILYKDDFEE